MTRNKADKASNMAPNEVETSKAKSTKKSPPRLQGEIKQRMKRQVTAVLVCTVAVFVVFFIPSTITEPIADGLKEWHKLLIKLGASIPVMILVPWIIFAQDQLATGASKASQFFSLPLSLYSRCQQIFPDPSRSEQSVVRVL